MRLLWGLLIFSLPFTDIEFPKAAKTFGEPSTYLAIVLCGLVLLKMLRGKESLGFLKTKASLFILVFWLVAGISISQSSKAPPSPWFAYASPWRTSLEQFAQLTVDLSVVFLTTYFVRSWKAFRFAMMWYFAGWIGSLCAQLIDFAAYFDAGSILVSSVGGFIHHTHLWQFIGGLPRLRLGSAEGGWAADYLLCVIPFFVMGAYYWKSRVWNRVNACVAIVALFATMSLGGLAIFLGEAAAMALFLGRRAAGLLIFAAAVPLLLALVISPLYVHWVWNRATEAYDYGIESTDFSTRARVALTESAWDAFEEHPWLGVGIGNSPFYVVGNMPTWAAQDPAIKASLNTAYGGDVSNLDFQILCETGLLGCVSFFIVIAMMAVGVIKAYRLARSRWMKSVFAAILVALLGQVAHSVTMSRFYYHYWFFIWGLAICAVGLARAVERDGPAGRFALSGNRPWGSTRAPAPLVHSVHAIPNHRPRRESP